MTPSLPRQRAQDPQQEQERPGQQQEAEEEQRAQQAEKVEEQGTGRPAQEQPTDEQVRSRLLTISQAPGHADAWEDGKRPQSSGDETDIYRRNLMSVSYLEVPEGA